MCPCIWLASRAEGQLPSTYRRALKGNDLQRVLASISVLDHDINHIEMVHHEALRAVRVGDRGVVPERERGEHGRDERRVVRDPIKHGVIGPVIHCVEADLKLDGLGSRGVLRDYLDRDERDVIDVNILEGCAVDAVDRGRSIVSDASSDICDN